VPTQLFNENSARQLEPQLSTVLRRPIARLREIGERGKEHEVQVDDGKIAAYNVDLIVTLACMGRLNAQLRG
jgi:hypothetical protein